ncbi:hypothetical protein JCM16161A_12610 [Vulcanisaeta sp. JCM 16161]|uniref:hypothetical protein n=1 Tax=Vulcanisaeta sp. JCM 16161 TaxID=1295372 RepID=UPI0006D02F91|nr:hypothetical protein [Vulcanisaeta sp. JCM 16161]
MMQSFFLTSWDIFRLVMSNWSTLFVIAVLPAVVPLVILVFIWMWGVRHIKNRGKLRVFNRVMIITVVIFIVVIVITVFSPLIMLPGKYGYSIVNNTLTLYLPTGRFIVNLSTANICVVNVTQAMRIEGFAYGPLGMGLFLVNGRYMNVFFYSPEGLRWIYVIKYGHEVLGLYTPGFQLPIKCGN